MPRRTFPRGNRSGPVRQTTWIALADQGEINVASGASNIISSFEPGAAAMLAPTIVRTRGEVTITPQTFGSDLDISGAFGVCIVSADAFAAGATSIPRPFDDADWGGWFVWQSFFYHLEFGDLTGVRVIGRSYQVDSKAMRKIKTNETLVQVCESQSGALSAAMHLRFLFKMS